MKLVVQRVKNAEVNVNNKTVGKIEKGYLVLLGVTHSDDEKVADYLVKKLINLRIFTDENDKMNLSLKQVDGSLLIISQFTLYADSSHGNRPSFIDSAKPEKAEKLYDYFCDKCSESGIKTEKGIFGADMKVSLLNDGPVTIIINSEELA